MTAALAIPGNTASTFLTHFFGSGLADDTYVVERFKAYVAQRIMLRRRRIPLFGSDAAMLAAT